jgi:hypothetical protein
MEEKMKTENMNTDGGMNGFMFIIAVLIGILVTAPWFFVREANQGKSSKAYAACLSKRSEIEMVFMQNQMTVREMPNGWLVSKGDDGSPTFVAAPTVTGFFGTTDYCSPQ